MQATMASMSEELQASARSFCSKNDGHLVLRCLGSIVMLQSLDIRVVSSIQTMCQWSQKIAAVISSICFSISTVNSDVSNHTTCHARLTSSENSMGNLQAIASKQPNPSCTKAVLCTEIFHLEQMWTQTSSESSPLLC